MFNIWGYALIPRHFKTSKSETRNVIPLLNFARGNSRMHKHAQTRERTQTSSLSLHSEYKCQCSMVCADRPGVFRCVQWTCVYASLISIISPHQNGRLPDAHTIQNVDAKMHNRASNMCCSFWTEKSIFGFDDDDAHMARMQFPYRSESAKRDKKYQSLGSGQGYARRTQDRLGAWRFRFLTICIGARCPYTLWRAFFVWIASLTHGRHEQKEMLVKRTNGRQKEMGNWWLCVERKSTSALKLVGRTNEKGAFGMSIVCH